MANRNGRAASCPWCDNVFTYGERDCPKDEKRFCSDRCARSYRADEQKLQAIDFTGDPYLAVQRAIEESNRKSELERAQLVKARKPRTVWCNSCVRTQLFVPSTDSHKCSVCDYPLSIYGPFDERPSWASSTLLKPNHKQRVQALGVGNE